ncbi:unnamed protein product, partial [marine sediment metagenome]
LPIIGSLLRVSLLPKGVKQVAPPPKVIKSEKRLNGESWDFPSNIKGKLIELIENLKKETE